MFLISNLMKVEKRNIKIEIFPSKRAKMLNGKRRDFSFAIAGKDSFVRKRCDSQHVSHLKIVEILGNQRFELFLIVSIESLRLTSY